MRFVKCQNVALVEICKVQNVVALVEDGYRPNCPIILCGAFRSLWEPGHFLGLVSSETEKLITKHWYSLVDLSTFPLTLSGSEKVPAPKARDAPHNNT